MAGATWFIGAAFCPQICEVQAMKKFAEVKDDLYFQLAANFLFEPEMMPKWEDASDALYRGSCFVVPYPGKPAHRPAAVASRWHTPSPPCRPARAGPSRRDVAQRAPVRVVPAGAWVFVLQSNSSSGD